MQTRGARDRTTNMLVGEQLLCHLIHSWPLAPSRGGMQPGHQQQFDIGQSSPVLWQMTAESLGLIQDPFLIFDLAHDGYPPFQIGYILIQAGAAGPQSDMSSIKVELIKK